MRVRAVKNTSPFSDPGWAILFVGIGSLLAVSFLEPVLVLIPPCVVHSLTGWPCPSCGTTRAALALAGGELLAGLRLQPLFVLVCVVVGLFSLHAPLAAIAGKKLRFELDAGERVVLRCVLVVLVVLNWFYLAAAGR